MSIDKRGVFVSREQSYTEAEVQALLKRQKEEILKEHDEKLAVRSGTITKTFTDTFTNDSTFLQCDGHLAILNLQFRYSTGFAVGDYIDLYTVSPAPSKATYYTFEVRGCVATIRITTAGAVQIYPYDNPYTQFVRCAIPYFY